MKHEDIVDMAKAAGAANFYPKIQTVKADNYLVGQEFLERFAKLVATKEREACAKVADECATWNRNAAEAIAEQIRARGEA